MHAPPLQHARLWRLRRYMLRNRAAVEFGPPLPHLNRLAIYDSAIQSSHGVARFNLRHLDESESSR
jgi:hypothetical protein